jgi:hypothetical protein
VRACFEILTETLQLLAFIIDRLQHGIRMPEHIVVHEPNHVTPAPLNPLRASLVIRCPVAMRRAIEFDHERYFVAIEVGDVPREPVLPSKLQSIELPITDELPQFLFRWGGVVAHRAGAAEEFVVDGFSKLRHQRDCE